MSDDANSRRLSGEDRSRNDRQAHLPHQFSEAGHHLVAHRLGGLWGDVPRGRSGAAGRHDQRATFDVGQLDERSRHRGNFVGHESCDAFPLVRQVGGEEVTDRGTPEVFVDARRCAIGDGDDADAGGAHE